MYCQLRLLLLVVAGFITASLSACQKETPVPELITRSQLEGRWKLTQTSGIFTGRDVPADPTQEEEITFEPNGQVQFLLNGAVTASATYALAQGVARTTNRTETFVTYSAPATTLRQYLAAVSATTLVIRDDNADAFSATYQRVSLGWCGTR